jgi:hypothetical protein
MINVVVNFCINELTVRSRGFDNPSFPELLKKFPTFYGTWRFITVFTRARHWSLSWDKWIQFTRLHPISLRYILMLSFYLRLFFFIFFLSFWLFHQIPIRYILLGPQCVLHALSSSLTWSFLLYLAKSKCYEAPHYAVFSNLNSFVKWWNMKYINYCRFS